jgi:hypothetical protein
MFAHTAYVFGRTPSLAAEAPELTSRAIAAWKNYERTAVKRTDCDDGTVHAARADWSVAEQNAAAVVAAVYLYAVTDDPAYGDYVKAHYRELHPYRDIGWSRYEPEQGEALLFYTRLPHADRELSKTLLADKMSDVTAGNQIYRFDPADDLYQAFMHDGQYVWGSNSTHAQYGNSNLDVVTYGLDRAHESSYAARALGIVHYFHGVNPFSMVYLSNMYRYGATVSANEIYHTWYAHDSRWSDALTSSCGPAPGYLPGGPNASAARDGVPSDLVPPVGQPPQKSYRDWNVSWPDRSYAVTEPAIHYQAAYIKLLSKFSE